MMENEIDNEIDNVPPIYLQLRSIAYQIESDPLFFMEQRGDVPNGTWLAKVDEIKKRYPK